MNWLITPFSDIWHFDDSDYREQSEADHCLPERHKGKAERLAIMLFPLNNKLAD